MSRKPIDLSKLPVPDKKRRRASWFAPVKRLFVRKPSGGGFVRWLQVDRYDESGNERTFVLFLESNDPRPRGIEICKTSNGGTDEDRAYYCRIFAHLPKGMWLELEYAAPASRTIAGLLTERAINREEAA